MNKIQKFSVVSLALFTTFILLSCGNEEAVSSPHSPNCRPQQAKCSATIDGVTAEFWLDPGEYANEIPLPINITLSVPSAGLVGARLTGDNMYMGYIPVILEQEKEGNFTGDMYLASCTQNDMRWLLTLEVETVNAKNIRFQFLFLGPDK